MDPYNVIQVKVVSGKGEESFVILCACCFIKHLEGELGNWREKERLKIPIYV